MVSGQLGLNPANIVGPMFHREAASKMAPAAAAVRKQQQESVGRSDSPRHGRSRFKVALHDTSRLPC